MSSIPVRTLDDTPEDTRQTLANSPAERANCSPHADMTHFPVMLAAYASTTQAIAGYGSCNDHPGEALAVGNADGCDYCGAALLAADLFTLDLQHYPRAELEVPTAPAASR